MTEGAAPLVSVAMITYNHGPYIAEAIEGVLRQQVDFPIELVIGEDCSTDHTREIVFDYQRRYPEIVRVITSEANVGAQRNSLRVIRACRGKYIAFCEGDDYWHHPEKLAIQVAYLEAHPEVGLVHSAVEFLDMRTGRRYAGPKATPVMQNPSDENTCWQMLMRRYRVYTPTVCARLALLRNTIESDPVLFQTDRFRMGDLQLWFELSRRAQVTYAKERLATYRLSENSATRCGDWSKTLEFAKSSGDLREYLMEKYSCPRRFRRVIGREHRKAVFRIALVSRDYPLAIQTLAEARRQGWRDCLSLWMIIPTWRGIKYSTRSLAGVLSHYFPLRLFTAARRRA